MRPSVQNHLEELFFTLDVFSRPRSDFYLLSGFSIPFLSRSIKRDSAYSRSSVCSFKTFHQKNITTMKRSPNTPPKVPESNCTISCRLSTWFLTQRVLSFSSFSIIPLNRKRDGQRGEAPFMVFIPVFSSRVQGTLWNEVT